ncbi:MAG TPA: hypothetical protein VL068_14940, partial [Microthrixaceae bacterium]|nr:hypothetical protein [Microthrixaceae bacterium]
MPRPGLLIPLFISATLLVSATGCGGSDSAESTDRSSTTTAASGHGGHTGDQQYGGVHAPPVVKASEVAKSGPGPEIGDTWTASIGVNVCGRFLDPMPGVATNGITPQPNG